MSELYEISRTTGVLTQCPVILADESTCGKDLEVVVTNTIIGDDYGSAPRVMVDFFCGHTLLEMETSILMSEFV
jgi:hypothetical protein